MTDLMAHQVDRRLVSAAIHLSRIKADLERIDRDLVPADRMDALKRLEDVVQVGRWVLEECRTGRVRKRAKTLADVADIEEYRRKYLHLESDGQSDGATAADAPPKKAAPRRRKAQA